jgi:hypothetical protein
MVRWSDISMHQGKKLLPEARGKEELFTHCMACHGFESRMAAVVRDEDGWRDRVNYMKDAMGYFIMPGLQLQRTESRERRLLRQPDVRRGLQAAEVARRPAAVQERGPAGQR